METQDDNNLNDQGAEIINLDSIDEEQAQIVAPSAARLPLAPRFKRRIRILQSTALALFTIILLFALLFNYTPTRNVVLHSVASLFPPPLAAGLNSFYLDASPGWGQLFVDGKRINPLPLYDIGDNALVLARGTHHLTWHAPPFTDQHCTISMPPDLAHDTCQYNHDVSGSQGHNSGWLISFSVSLAQLSPGQRTALIQAMQAALNAQEVTTIVQPGESYAAPPSYAAAMYSNAQADAKATRPLRATLHFQFDTTVSSQAHCIDDIFEEQAESGCWFDSQNCLLLCSFPAYEQHLAYPASQWITYGMVRSLWDYSTLSGQPVATNQPDLDAQGAIQDEHRLPFSISWSHHSWHVTTAISNKNLLPAGPSPFCYPAQDELFQYNMIQMLADNGQAITAYTIDYQTTPNPADGCIVTLNLGQDTAPGIPEAIVAGTPQYLERFGVFVALNGAAQKLWPWPTMPMADTYEQHLAQQVADATNQNSDLTVKYSGEVVK